MWGKYMKKGMGKLDILLKDVGSLIRHILEPSNLALMGTLVGVVSYSFKRIQVLLDKRQDQMIEELKTRLCKVEASMNEDMKDMKVEILRVQILTGIDTHRFSRGEILYFFDKYKALGGNSFVEDKCHSYLEQLEKEGR